MAAGSDDTGPAFSQPHTQVAATCLKITPNDGELLLRNRATTICNIAMGSSGQMDAIVRAYIVIAALAVVAISARIHTANTSVSYDAGYTWAKQRGIYEADNGMGVPPPLRADEVQKKLGPEFVALAGELGKLDPNSKESREIGSILDKLDELCGD